MKKYKTMLIILAVLIVIWFGLRFIVGGSEDTWRCVGGEWVRHGHPSAPMPEGGCGPAPVSSRPAHCPEWVNCMPGPEVAGDCTIPPGCEEWTQVAW